MAITKVTSGLISADASSIDLNIDAGTLYLDVSENRVGIGTSSPDTLTHIAGGAGSAVLRLENTDSFLSDGEIVGKIEFETQDSGGAGVNAYIQGVGVSTNGATRLDFGTGSSNSPSTRMTINSNGNVDIGGYSLNSSTGIELKGSSGQINHDVNTDNTATTTIMINSRIAAGGNACLQYRTNNVIEGSLLGSSTGLAISNVSDYRKKQNIRNLTGSLDIIKSLQPRVYNYKEGFAKDTTKDYVGFIAHELSEYIPDSVIGTKDEVYTQNDIDNGVTDAVIGEPKYQSVLYSSNEILTRLVQSIQEQQTIIDNLTTRIETLENA